jgi:predicted O-linked N-acetylglucosamine transferase (SPINDLY family)
MDVQSAIDLAIRHHRAGRLADAESLYRQILASFPDEPDVIHMLALAAHQGGRTPEAMDLFAKAIRLRPDAAPYYCNIGIVLATANRWEESIAALRQAIALQPDLAEAHHNLGNALRNIGQVEQSIKSHRQAIALRPDYIEAYDALGVGLRESGRLQDAVVAHEKSISLGPSFSSAYSNLSSDYCLLGRIAEATTVAQKAVMLAPASAEAYLALANAYFEARRSDDAIAAYQAAINRKANWAEAFYGLGNALRQRELHDEAIQAYRRSLALRPNYAAALNNLGSILKDVGLLDEALESFAHSQAITPNAAVGSNALYLTYFHPAYDERSILEAHRSWNLRYAAPLAALIGPHSNDRAAERRLRVGYISPNLHNHPAIFLILPLFRNHDRNAFDVYIYSETRTADQLTEAAKAAVANWRDTARLSDEQLAQAIRQDRIDILVDLTVHMTWNRMLVLARKPAPVQITYLGYPGTTGLQTVDYRLSDRFLDPKAAGGEPTNIPDAYTEQTICLSGPWWCYDPLSEQPLVGPPPAAANGSVTFGCLNNFCKTNESHLEVWARILSLSFKSRLLILAPRGAARQRIVDFMSGRGIDTNRIGFADFQPRPSYLETYHRIDICLDTFPYNGHTTTLDAAWMGVPTISLSGKTAVSRGGLTILSHLGLPELCTSSVNEYISMAVNLAADGAKLSGLRAELRQRMRISPLMDASSFARDFEAIYRKTWKQWCASARP